MVTKTRRFATSSSSHSVNPVLKYNVAVAYHAKSRDHSFDAENNPCGEDNYVIRHGSNNNLVLGVADGVGGWADHKGASSADMSRELCQSIGDYFAKNESIAPLKLLLVAYNDLTVNQKVKVGGTTVCFGVVEGSKLNLVNLGDSWCGLFRGFKCVNQTKFQTLGFNTPKQLSVIPQELQEEARRTGKNYIHNSPADGDSYQFELQKNDVVVFATDGVTDNVYPEDIEIFLRDHFDSDVNAKVDLTKLAEKLVAGVVKLGSDPNYPSPFSQELSQVTGQNYSGGKSDDVTLVVLKVE